ncbi:Fasciclin-like arabinogalactan protein [Musa troglodytarum]|uniref:Fasciclin-like arabinogalactan protein n=2 Tax=Musa troglodytarum TaxID=320322 RepID=A0A9E7KXY4_9LILI|nr:Fasciclin-like arabinogalactan protein [Musa troglodytarum]
MRRVFPLLAASLLLLLAAASAPVAQGHNITKILAGIPEFSTFNHYLTVTHLASEINRRLTITLLAVDNSGMADLLAKHLSVLTLRNVLALHILTDYYGAKKLHQLTGGSTLASSVFQSSGHAPGTTGYINITDHRAGKVTFAAEDSGGAPPVSFVKSVKEMPYNISVLQVSTILSSPEAEAPVAAPAPVNLTALMAKKGCKAFADLLLARPDVLQIFQDNLDSGLTVFCPDDAAVKAFAPKYKNLTADGKASLLLYHGLPVYYSPQLLKANNGVVNTLATDGSNKNFNYTVQTDGTDITLKTRIVTATITSTLIDQDPDAVYVINKVLQPRELFKLAEVVDAPSPAPAGSKKAKHASPPTPAGPEEAPADQAASDNAAFRAGSAGRWLVPAAASLAAAVIVVV